MLLINGMEGNPANRIVVSTATTRDKYFYKPIYLIFVYVYFIQFGIVMIYFAIFWVSCPDIF